MSGTAGWRFLCAAVVLCGAAALTTRSAGLAAGGAASRVKAPRIVSAVVQDADGDFLADEVRLTYSARIRHAADADGSYPFTVDGYGIRRVDAAGGKILVIDLVEGAKPDPAAAPVIRYRRTTSDPVKSRAGRQAANQLFRATRAHGHVPPPPSADSDGDGIPDPQDCAPRDAAIHPGAPDLPDLSFVDSNCDGIDGTEADAVFVSPSGTENSPGTKARPLREIQAGIDAVRAGTGRYVLAAAGSYGHVQPVTGSAIYGGYDQSNWSRRSAVLETTIAGASEGIFVDGATHVVLQLLSVRGRSTGTPRPSAYGIRAVNGSALTLQRVTVTSGPGAIGTVQGADGVQGPNGARGENGHPGKCGDDGDGDYQGGKGGANAYGGRGGNGGEGGGADDGFPGEGLHGGAGGKSGDPGQPGGDGGDGRDGPPGRGGDGGAGVRATAAGAGGGGGGRGVDGTGGLAGGGGGGGGGQASLIYVEDDRGNGGGGGGGAGAGGGAGRGGGGGGGSFGVYLYNSILLVESSSIATGDGAPGGNGGKGALGGVGGVAGHGGLHCLSRIGRGGRGGHGGSGGLGGGGGGGAGGPSIGILEASGSKATIVDTTIRIGAAGAGGLGGGPFVKALPGLTGGDGAPGIAAKVFTAP
jgi:hypothetical protein